MAVELSPERRQHILYGNKTGGGHRHGAGKFKTEFPAGWSDQRIVEAVLSIANDHNLIGKQRGRRWIVDAQIDGLYIRVVIEDGVRVITAHPC